MLYLRREKFIKKGSVPITGVIRNEQPLPWRLRFRVADTSVALALAMAMDIRNSAQLSRLSDLSPERARLKP
jgi:hypothetical protein